MTTIISKVILLKDILDPDLYVALPRESVVDLYQDLADPKCVIDGRWETDPSDFVSVGDMVDLPEGYASRVEYVADLMGQVFMARRERDSITGELKALEALAGYAVDKDIEAGVFKPAGSTKDERASSRQFEVMGRLGESDWKPVMSRLSKTNLVVERLEATLEIQRFLLKSEEGTRDYIARVQYNNIRALESGSSHLVIGDFGTEPSSLSNDNPPW